MKECVLSLKDLQYDEPELHIELQASNGDTSATQDFYCYVEDLEQFANELIDFPSSITSEVRFEIGRRSSDWAYFVLVRTYVHDGWGHSALEIDLDCHAKAPYGHSMHFYILCEPASVNRLGKELIVWCRNRESPLEWYPSA